MKGYNISGDCLYPGGEKEALRRMKEKVSQVETLFVNSNQFKNRNRKLALSLSVGLVPPNEKYCSSFLWKPNIKQILFDGTFFQENKRWVLNFEKPKTSPNSLEPSTTGIQIQ